MADFTGKGGTTFPAGTDVSAYAVSSIAGWPSNPTPPQTAVATATISAGGTFVLTGLQDDTDYAVAGVVAGVQRWTTFRTKSAPNVQLGAGDASAANQETEIDLLGQILAATGGGGGGGGGDASAANQLDGIEQLQLVNTSLDSLLSNGDLATEAELEALVTAVELLATKFDTQPVSAATLPLPSGAATSAKQDTLATAVGLLAKLTDTQPVSLASQPLPTGAATSAKQEALGTLATQVTAAAILAKLTADPSTATLQGTGNTSLASILTALGSGGALAGLLGTGAGKTLHFAAISAATNGAGNTIVTGTASQKVKVISYTIVATGAVTVTWFQGTTAISGAMALAAGGGVSAHGSIQGGHLMETAAGADLKMTLSSAVQVSGHICWISEA